MFFFKDFVFFQNTYFQNTSECVKVTELKLIEVKSIKQVFIRWNYLFLVEFQNKPLPLVMGINIIYRKIHVEVDRE